MGILTSLLTKEKKDTPIKGFVPRIKNIALNNFRGLLGMLIPVLALTWQGDKAYPHLTVQCMWIWMAWFFLIHPVNIPVTGLIPIFLLPMAGVMGSMATCACYMNEGLMLFFLGSMLALLLNNSGVDRRMALWIIGSGGAENFSGPKLVFKCSAAAFFLSMVSNRLIVTSIIIDYVKPTLDGLTGASTDKKPDFKEMRYIICQAIQTSSAIGSIGIIHASYITLCFRAMFYKIPTSADIFNYAQYTIYALPVALVMFALNLGYHIVLFNMKGGKIPATAMNSIRSSILTKKKEIPAKVTLHEYLTIIFTVGSLAIFFFRWSKHFEGWATFRMNLETHGNNPLVRDATAAALFVMAAHALPKGYGFYKIFTAKKKSQISLKPESSILWWRFVDKNMNYGYMFLVGAGVALNASIRITKLDTVISHHFGRWLFTDHAWPLSIFIVCLFSVALANIMSGCAACVVLLPLILNMNNFDVMPLANLLEKTWVKDVYLGALAVGVGTNFGFMFPFLYTPAYFSHYSGKVPMKKMAMYGAGSAVICLLVLYVSILAYAPTLWDPTGAGVPSVDVQAQGTTGAPDAAPAPPEPAEPAD